MTDYMTSVLLNLKKCMHLNDTMSIEDEINGLSMNANDDDHLFDGK